MKQSNIKQLWALRGDLQRHKRQLSDNINNHKRLTVERTSATLKAPDLYREAYHNNLKHLEDIKKELTRIEREITHDETRIILLENDIKICESQNV